MVNYVKAGSRIEFRGETYIVTKVNRVNLRIMRESDEVGFTLPALANYTILADSAPIEKVYGSYELRQLGVVVRVKPAHRPGSFTARYSDNQPFVVVKLGTDVLHVVKLGGDGGHFWRFPPAALEKVEV